MKNRIILVIDDHKRTKKYKSINEVARALNIDSNTVDAWLKGKTPKRYEGWQILSQEDSGSDFTTKDTSRYDTDPKTGAVLATTKNIAAWLTVKYESFRYNELTNNLEVNGKPIDDRVLDEMCCEMEESIGVNNDKKTKQAITYLCVRDSYNPLKQKIESVEWDGVERAEMFFIKFLGAFDNQLNRKYTRCWFKAAIKRLYEPGCMWDNMLILYDKTQQTGKTKIFERLSLGYYTANPDISNKDCINIMNNAWLINFDELARFDKKDMNTLKTFMTIRSEINRLAYARYAETYERHCVFCGTTNEQHFLRDYTSERERRFWIMNCKGTRRENKWWKENLPDSYIEQLWAEVKHWYDEDPDVEGLTMAEMDEETIVQAGHKSFYNKPEDELMIRDILNGKYSKMALENWKVFKKEVMSSTIEDSQILPLNKVEIKRLAALIHQKEDYASAIVLAQPGWLVRDGYAIRTEQYSMEL